MPRKPQNPTGRRPPDTLPSWLESQAFSEEEIERYQDAAHRCGLEVSHWARQMLNAAAREILDLEDRPRARGR